MTVMDYYHWLCRQIRDNPDYDISDYAELLTFLFDYDYYGIVANDDNRASDGVNLREHAGLTEDISDKPCSVLEMLIALAQRANDIMIDDSGYDRTGEFFWAMIENSGLDRFNNERLRKRTAQFMLDQILNNILERRYGYSGRGGFFPLLSANEDQRHVELAYQMQSWLLENYGQTL